MEEGVEVDGVVGISDQPVPDPCSLSPKSQVRGERRGVFLFFRFRSRKKNDRRTMGAT